MRLKPPQTHSTISSSDPFTRQQVSLSQDLSCGTVVRTFMDDVLDDQPATAVRKGNSLYVIIFRNTTPFEDIPNTPYEIYRVDRDGDAVVDMCLEAS